MERGRPLEGLAMTGYRGKRVFVTGHTGFKGAWLTQILLESGAEVCGYALQPPTRPSLFELLSLSEHCRSVTGDIRNLDALTKAMADFRPEIVFHLAAQPLVIDSYENPVYTYETNVMGTVYLLEATRKCGSVRSIVNVTTDKVYQNNEWVYGYRESDALNGHDPYSNSKSCSELVTDSYKKSFFNAEGIAVSTVRAGNVVGGGDFSMNRIVPDCYRAVTEGKPVIVRNPNSIRPYQHVLEPLFVYLIIGEKQLRENAVSGCYNVGPSDADCVNTLEIANLYKRFNPDLSICIADTVNTSRHEATLLRLDCSKLRVSLGLVPLWKIDVAIEKTVELYNVVSQQTDIREVMSRQIREYESLMVC